MGRTSVLAVLKGSKKESRPKKCVMFVLLFFFPGGTSVLQGLKGKKKAPFWEGSPESKIHPNEGSLLLRVPYLSGVV